VYFLQRIRNPWSLCLVLALSVILNRGSAQQVQMYDLPNNTKPNQLPALKEKEPDVGSRYLIKKWSRGTVELWNHKRLPEGNEYLLFNYDKMNNEVCVMDQYAKQRFYPIDSVNGFDFVDNSVIYSFEKIPLISNKFLLMSIYKSEKGYSLYKRMYTKYIPSGYVSSGYYSEGKKYDEYIDDYEYYLVYPGNTSYRKLYLKESVIRRALKEESKLINDYFNMHEDDINEQSLIGIVQYIDDNKYPE
jgi:hypothetical protein